jgi:hypothetical protein
MHCGSESPAVIDSHRVSSRCDTSVSPPAERRQLLSAKFGGEKALDQVPENDQAREKSRLKILKGNEGPPDASQSKGRDLCSKHKAQCRSSSSC